MLVANTQLSVMECLNFIYYVAHSLFVYFTIEYSIDHSVNPFKFI
jgi:hypothetical protein